MKVDIKFPNERRFENKIEELVVSQLTALADLNHAMNISMYFHGEAMLIKPQHRILRVPDVEYLIQANAALFMIGLVSFSSSLTQPGGVLRYLCSDLKRTNSGIKKKLALFSHPETHEKKENYFYISVLDRVLKKQHIDLADLNELKSLLIARIKPYKKIRDELLAHPYESLHKEKFERLEEDREHSVPEKYEKLFYEIRSFYAFLRFVAIPDKMFPEDQMVNMAKRSGTSSAKQLVDFAFQDIESLSKMSDSFKEGYEKGLGRKVFD